MLSSLTGARREWLAVLAFTLLGAVIRFWDAGRLGILHFDEGIYALAGLWVRSSRGLASLDPSVAFYAPPVFPTLVGVTYLLLGVSDTSAVLVSLLAGVLTIPVAAWVAGRAFGRGAAAAAAALVALSGQHVAFSRMALTDATFLLLFLVSLGLGMRFLERPGVVRALLFGLAVGLAQLTKYNGFLAGVTVALVAALGLLDREPARRRLAQRAFGFGLLAAATAALCYWPWFQFVQTRVPGGYAALIQHHRGYVSAPAQWPRNAVVQWAEAITLAGKLSGWIGWGAVGWALAWLAAMWTSGRLVTAVRSSERPARWARLALPLGIIVLGALPDAPWWLTLASLPLLWRGREVGPRVLASAWVVQSLLLPMYHPYARLALPLVALGQLIVAEWLALAVTGVRQEGVAARVGSRPMWASLVIVLLLALGLRIGVGWPAPAKGVLAPTDGLRWLGNLAKTVPAPLPDRVYLLGRPSLLFYLTTGQPLEVLRLPEGVHVSSRIEYGSVSQRFPPVRRAKQPWLIVDGALEPRAKILMRLDGITGPQSWDQGNLVMWLDIDPSLAFEVGRYQIVEETFRVEKTPRLDRFTGQSHPELIIIHKYREPGDR